jgi:hypothetical protein
MTCVRRSAAEPGFGRQIQGFGIIQKSYSGASSTADSPYATRLDRGCFYHYEAYGHLVSANSEKNNNCQLRPLAGGK